MKTFSRWVFRILVTLFFLVVLLAVVAVLLKDVIAKSLAEKNLRDNTGMDAKIEKMEIGLATPTVNLEGLKLYNTADFGGGTFLEMPELRVEYVPGDIRDGKLHFKTVRVNLSEVHIIKNKQGKTNIDIMQKETKKKSAGQKSKSNTPGIDFGSIDTIYLKIGKVKYTDERNPRNSDEFNLGSKEEVGRNLKTEVEVEQWFQIALFRMAMTQAAKSSGSDRERWQKLIPFLWH